MEQAAISEDRLQSISTTILGVLRKDGNYSRAWDFLSTMATSVPPRIDLPSTLFGIDDPQVAFQTLQSLQGVFSGIFHKLLKDAIQLQDQGPSALNWDQLEAKVIPQALEGKRIKIRFVLQWKTPSGVLAFNDGTRWK